eukprot:m.297204 g.297204  ORF g.297204 m.297204 type:complete len:201 (-) comp19526_c1_seq2:150-752(-)
MLERILYVFLAAAESFIEPLLLCVFNCLQGRPDTAKDECLEGVTVHQHGFPQAVTQACEAVALDRGRLPVVLVLSEDGAPVDSVLSEHSDAIRAGGIVTVLGDNRGLNSDEEHMVDALIHVHASAVVKASFGPVPLLASHCIVLTHHYLDRCVHACRPTELAVCTPESNLRTRQRASTFDTWVQRHGDAWQVTQPQTPPS